MGFCVFKAQLHNLQIQPHRKWRLLVQHQLKPIKTLFHPMNQCLVMLIVNSMARHTCIYKQIPCPTSLISERSQEMLISHQNMKDIRASADLSTLYCLSSVCTLSILYSTQPLRYWQDAFVQQSIAPSVGDHFLHSHDLNVWFRGDNVRRN